MGVEWMLMRGSLPKTKWYFRLMAIKKLRVIVRDKDDVDIKNDNFYDKTLSTTIDSLCQDLLVSELS